MINVSMHVFLDFIGGTLLLFTKANQHFFVPFKNIWTVHGAVGSKKKKESEIETFNEKSDYTKNIIFESLIDIDSRQNTRSS